MKFSRIKTPEQLQVGKSYFCLDKAFHKTYIETCKADTPDRSGEELRKYLGNRIWAMKSNPQAFLRWDIYGPIPDVSCNEDHAEFVSFVEPEVEPTETPPVHSSLRVTHPNNVMDNCFYYLKHKMSASYSIATCHSIVDGTDVFRYFAGTPEKGEIVCVRLELNKTFKEYEVFGPVPVIPELQETLRVTHFNQSAHLRG